MSRNSLHYAVVVGISHYPGGYRTLNGPVNDAEGFAKWLMSAKGGGLPARNVKLIVSPRTPITDVLKATPTKEPIDGALWDLINDCRDAVKSRPEYERPAARLNSRLYIYVAGHGIMPGEGQAALLDAKADPLGRKSNLELAAYREWFVRDGTFGEICIFADCCRTGEPNARPGIPDFDRATRSGSVFALVGWATEEGALAYEQVDDTIPVSDRRGYFSMSLLEGLKGRAARNPEGFITAESLAIYTGRRVATLSGDRPPRARQVVQMPIDPNRPMTFGVARKGLDKRSQHHVKLEFPAKFARKVDIVSPQGASWYWEPRVGPWESFVTDGLYFVRVAGSTAKSAGLAHFGTFEVAGDNIEVSLVRSAADPQSVEEPEPAGADPVSWGRLVVEAPGCTITVQDSQLNEVVRSTAAGSLDRRLPSGVYRVVARIGPTEESRLVVIRPMVRLRLAIPLRFETAATVYNAATENESHATLAATLTGPIIPPTDEGALVVLLRILPWHKYDGLIDQGADEAPAPNAGDLPSDVRHRIEAADVAGSFELFDADGTEIELPVAEYDWTHRAVGWRWNLPAGGYLLRWSTGPERAVDQAIWVAADWQTVMFVPLGQSGPRPASGSVQLLPKTGIWSEGPDPDAWETEARLADLRAARPSPASNYRDILGRDGSPPMLRLIAAVSLLTLAWDADPDPETLTDLRTGYQQLVAELGADCPDVIALETDVGESDRDRRRATWPPMLSSSYDLLLRADRAGREVIVPGSTAESASIGRLTGGPWLLWMSVPRALMSTRPLPADDVFNVGFQAYGAVETSSMAEMFREFEFRYKNPVPLDASGPRQREPYRQIQELLDAVGQRLKIADIDAFERLGVDEIARRLQLPKEIVRQAGRLKQKQERLAGERKSAEGEAAKKADRDEQAIKLARLKVRRGRRPKLGERSPSGETE